MESNEWTIRPGRRRKIDLTIQRVHAPTPSNGRRCDDRGRAAHGSRARSLRPRWAACVAPDKGSHLCVAGTLKRDGALGAPRLVLFFVPNSIGECFKLV